MIYQVQNNRDNPARPELTDTLEARLAAGEKVNEKLEKARASWDYFGFEHVAEPGTFCAEMGWDGWRAVLTASGNVIVTDEGLDLNTAVVFGGIKDFVEWLEITADERAEEEKADKMFKEAQEKKAV